MDIDGLSGARLERLLSDQKLVDQTVAIALSVGALSERTQQLLRTESLRDVLMDNTTGMAEELYKVLG